MCSRWPVVDLPATMSKFLYLGMPMEQIIRAATSVPAKAMRVHERLGTLLPGRQADITILKLEQGQFPLTDVEGVTRISPRQLVPISVCKRGKWSGCGLGNSARTQSSQHRDELVIPRHREIR